MPTKANTSSAHTDLPWKIRMDFDPNYAGQYYDSKLEILGGITQKVIATLPADFAVTNNEEETKLREEAKANARLIAAAPELLESMKWTLDERVRFPTDDQLAKMRSAIAKVEGQ